MQAHGMIIGKNDADRHAQYSRKPSLFSVLARWIAAMAAAYLIVSMQTISVHAQSPVLELDGPAGADRIGGHIDYYLDFSHELTPDDIVSGNAVDFVPIETEVPDFGYTDAMVWLRLRIANDSADRFDWRLYFHENFKQIFEVYVVRGDGKIENLSSPLGLGH